MTASILDDCEEQAGGGGGGRARSSFRRNITNLSVIWRLGGGGGEGGLNKKIIIFTNICKQADQMPVALEN